MAKGRSRPLVLSQCELATLIVSQAAALAQAVQQGIIGKILILKTCVRLAELAEQLPEELPRLPGRDDDDDDLTEVVKH